MYDFIHNNDLVGIKNLIDSGFDINEKNYNENTSLYNAIRYNRYEIVQLLIQNNANVNDLNKERKTPINYAIQYNSLPILKLLIDSGADLNQLYSKSVWSYLHNALYWCRFDIIQFLIETNKVNINVKTCRDESLLHFAVYFGSWEITKYLIESGVDINAKCNINLTPLHCAVDSIKKDIVEMLCNAGANVNAIGGLFELTPLYLAIQKDLDIALFLLDCNADYTIVTKNNETMYDLAKPEFISKITNKIIELKLYTLWEIKELDKYEMVIQWVPRELLEDLCSIIKQ